MPRKSSASRRSRIRRLGFLSLLLTTLLTPAGIIVSTVTAAALIGGAFHLSRATPEAPATPSHRASAKPGSPQYLSIERDGKPMTLVMAEDEIGTGGSVDSFNPDSPLFAGLAGNGPTQIGTPGGMPSGRSPGRPMPDGGFRPDIGGPANPRPGKDDADEPSNEESAPEKPNEKPILAQPKVKPQPNPDNQPPEKENGLPPDTLPGLPTLPLADTPVDTQTPLRGKDLVTQPNAVPEPSMLGLMLLGGVAMAWAGRRRPAPLRPA